MRSDHAKGGQFRIFCAPSVLLASYREVSSRLPVCNLARMSLHDHGRGAPHRLSILRFLFD